jgi:hypothetical protein
VKRVASMLATVGLLWATSAAAQTPAAMPPGHPAVTTPAAPTATMPPGHPTVTAAATPTGAMPPGHPAVTAPAAPTGAMPPGHPAVTPPAAPTGAMPPGHPQVGDAAAGAMPAGHPSVAGGGKQAAPELPEDSIVPDAELPPTTIEAQLLDPQDRPIAGADVRLGIMFQKIAEGESRSELHLKSGPDGIARFDGLKGGTTFSYRITTKNGPGEFASTPFNLREQAGMRVKLHVYPVTENVNETMIGMRGIFYIETRDDVFSIEGIFRVMNLGQNAWVPRDVVVALPDGFKGFSGGETMFDARFSALEGRGAKLEGTFPPGQRDLNFRFSVPKPAEPTAVFRFGPAPRTFEVRVIAVASKAMGLDVEGFEATQSGTGPSGDHVLVTRKVAARSDPQLAPFVVTLTGLTMPGPGRWVAILIALVIAAAGGLAGAGKWRIASTEKIESDRARAVNLLLDELVALTRAKERGEIGPHTHDQTRRSLIDALARIGLPKEARKSKRLGKPVNA